MLTRRRSIPAALDDGLRVSGDLALLTQLGLSPHYDERGAQTSPCVRGRTAEGRNAERRASLFERPGVRAVPWR
ncbi:hypothetical protein [Pseudonocardia sp. N23]|uniref:hypothetical protein n=1 Tax=Pseudonocardia sp. N23 TaxID=1987376 RepID=UPI000BFE1087|nr:hypothetical protein [Pseudonocardia sp. N23]GAY11789.1 hypothetical protein TOK_0173 [Pseudonocardia sp. N23]